MKSKIALGLLCNLLLFPVAVFAQEVDSSVEETVEQEIYTEDNNEENIVTNELELTDSNENDPTNESSNINNITVDNSTDTNDNDEATNDPATEESEPIEKHKVAVIIKKEDEKGNYLAGATIQILDSEGNIVDEWVSTLEDHTILLPEGDYTLHEVIAPGGYMLAEDKTFTVEVVIHDVTAGVEHDDDPAVCWHYSGVPFFYIDNNGEKEEVYCINQDWEEPHDVDYNGVVLTEDNIRDFAPDADPTMTNKELYNKVVDIVYRRTKAEENFSDLSETEIRMLTEYALKNYTSTQVNDGTWARGFTYDASTTEGYRTTPGEGDTFGRLANHWWTRHYKTKIPSRYADYYYYLIGDGESHPSDMHLYIYSTNLTSEHGPYQNLIGIKWYNPYDENQKVEITFVNNPETGDDIMSYVAMSIFGIGSVFGGMFFLKKEF